MARLIAEPMSARSDSSSSSRTSAALVGRSASAASPKPQATATRCWCGTSARPPRPLYDNYLRYDVFADFEPIGRVTDVPMTIVGKKDLSPKDIGELIAWVKAKQVDGELPMPASARQRTCAACCS